MKINYNNITNPNLYTNPLKNINLTNKKYQDNSVNTKQDVIVDISDDGIDKYFNENIFKAIADEAETDSNRLSVKDNNSSDIIKKFGEKYAEIYDKIIEKTPDNKKEEYLDRLDSAFQDAVDNECSKMLHKIEKLYKEENMESSLNKKSYAELFNNVAFAAKDYFLEDSKQDFNKYIESKIDFSKVSDFKTYETFAKVTDIFDSASKISDKMNKLKELLLSSTPEEIIESKNLMNQINKYTSSLNKDIKALNELMESIDDADINVDVKKELMGLLESKSDKLNDMNSKMQKYQDLLEKYDKVKKRLDKANAKKELINAKLDKANQTKNQELISMYLKRIESINTQVSELEVQSAQLEAEMADLLKDISESEI
ncbi:hypothetical protein SH1V18_39110 [Vallitalea longa]|uniref:Uncharacterized protein n=1 Tax=Vallitalea longa TaxID=2936439 RepID=A0A9W5YEX8_9FIRM|nr:hypothetical protein [Vallitalea longa]GKX31431.1 hypothetical protein SH1V18_39110 [Vallitalea longa]